MEFSHSYIAEFVKRAQTGDNDAFAELYNIALKKVYNYARHYFRDEYLAQDAVQEVFINAYRNIRNLKDPTLFIAWINQIAFHVCFDMAKKNNSAPDDMDDELLEQVSDTGPDSNPEETAVNKDEKERLKAAIDRLSENEKQLVTLRYFNQMKIEDIVDATGISRSTVKRQLAAAIEKLKLLMKE